MREEIELKWKWKTMLLQMHDWCRRRERPESERDLTLTGPKDMHMYHGFRRRPGRPPYVRMVWYRRCLRAPDKNAGTKEKRVHGTPPSRSPRPAGRASCALDSRPHARAPPCMHGHKTMQRFPSVLCSSVHAWAWQGEGPEHACMQVVTYLHEDVRGCRPEGCTRVDGHKEWHRGNATCEFPEEVELMDLFMFNMALPYKFTLRSVYSVIHWRSSHIYI